MINIEQDMTIYTAAEMKQVLFEKYNSLSAVELDLSRVGEMDTAGLQLLIVSKKTLEEQGKRFNLKKLSPAVEEVLSTYGLNKYFNA